MKIVRGKYEDRLNYQAGLLIMYAAKLLRG
jgi:hypothetical protein